jgi:hypothetical protein
MNNLLLEILIVIITLGILLYMKKSGHKEVMKKFGIMLLAVFLFQIMSEPMWINSNLHSWAYLYGNVSWVLTFGWASIFFLTFLIVDNGFKKMPEKNKFWLYLLVATIITVPAESLILKLGIRSYADILSQTFSGIMIPLTLVPIEVLIATPMISALIIPFYKYVIQKS